VAPARGVTVSQTYDANGNVTTTTGPRGELTRQSYDHLDRPARLELVSPTRTAHYSWRYNAAGRVLVHHDANAVLHRHRYDALGQLVETRLDLAEVARPRDVPEDADDVETFTYDGLGRLVRHANKHAAVDVWFDSLGRALRESLTLARWPEAPLELTREFDSFGRVHRVTYPSGRVLEHEHDQLNRLVRIRNVHLGHGYPGHPATPDAYDIAQLVYGGLRLARLRYGSGAGYSVTYDTGGRVIGLRHHGPADALLLEIQQLHDAAGNKRLELEVYPDPAGGVIVESEGYAYDALNRLTHHEPFARVPLALDGFAPARVARAVPAGQAAIDVELPPLPGVGRYEYDAAGNRTASREVGGPILQYEADILNQYTRVTEAGGATLGPSWDAAGNLVAVADRRLYYTAANRLARVEIAGQTVVRLAYDAQGRLLSMHRPATGTTTFVVHDGVNEIAEYEATPFGFACTAQYVNAGGADSRIQLAAEQREVWYHTDTVRSTRLLSTVAGTLVRYRYTPYGRLRSITPAVHVYNPYRFSGRRWEPGLDAYDFRARVYLPEWGRFIQRDPKGAADGLNLYAALGNNPMLFTDPFGTEKQGFFEGLAGAGLGLYETGRALWSAGKSMYRSLESGVDAIGEKVEQLEQFGRRLKEPWIRLADDLEIKSAELRNEILNKPWTFNLDLRLSGGLNNLPIRLSENMFLGTLDGQVDLALQAGVRLASLSGDLLDNASADVSLNSVIDLQFRSSLLDIDARGAASTGGRLAPGQVLSITWGTLDLAVRTSSGLNGDLLGSLSLRYALKTKELAVHATAQGVLRYSLVPLSYFKAEVDYSSFEGARRSDVSATLFGITAMRVPGPVVEVPDLQGLGRSLAITSYRTLPAIGYGHYSKSDNGSLLITLGAATDLSQTYVGGSVEVSF
jgi:RHS repeat-associated protein